MIEDFGGHDAVLGLQLNWRDVRAEHRRPAGSLADFLGVVWELDIEGTFTKYLLKEKPIRRRLQPECDASRIGEHHLLSIDRRTLCLVGVRTL